MSEMRRAGSALTEQDKTDIRRDIGLGTAAEHDAPTGSSNATSGQLVKGNDTRLTDARTPSGTAIASATSKTTPVDADSLPIADSAASNGLKRLTWANLKATIQAAFDSVYQAVLVSGTNIKTINGTSVLGSGDITVGGGSGATNLSYTASSTNGIVASDTGTDATIPLSDGTNAGLMAPAQHTKLAGIGAGANVTSVAGKTGVVTLAAADVGDSTVAGRALLTAADAAAQRSALGLGTAATTASTAYAASGAVTSSGLTMATARLLGRSTAGTGAPEEITLGTNLSFTGTTLNAAGGGGSPGGSDGQIQRNNAGSFAGSNISQDASGRITVAAGTQTTAGSALALSYTANGAGQTIDGLTVSMTDTASAAASAPLRVQVGGVTRVSVPKSGALTLNGNGVSNVTLLDLYYDSGATRQAYIDSFVNFWMNQGSILFGSTAGTPGSMWIQGGNGHIYTRSSGIIGWGSSGANGAIDIAQARNSAGVMEINSGAAGTFRDLRVRSVIQQPPATITPASNGDLVFEATSNTTITVKLRGSDGTVRSGTITLS